MREEGRRKVVGATLLCLSSGLLPPTGQLHLGSIFSEIFVKLCSPETFYLLWQQQWQVGCIEKAVDLISAADGNHLKPSPRATDNRKEATGWQTVVTFQMRERETARAREGVAVTCVVRREQSLIAVCLVRVTTPGLSSSVSISSLIRSLRLSPAGIVETGRSTLKLRWNR